MEVAYWASTYAWRLELPKVVPTAADPYDGKVRISPIAVGTFHELRQVRWARVLGISCNSEHIPVRRRRLVVERIVQLVQELRCDPIIIAG